MAWSKEFDGLINSAAIATSADRHALESNLQQANSEFMRAGLLAWSRFVRSDSTQINNIFDALGTTSLLLEESRGMMRRPDERAALEQLLKYPRGIDRSSRPSRAPFSSRAICSWSVHSRSAPMPATPWVWSQSAPINTPSISQN